MKTVARDVCYNDIIPGASHVRNERVCAHNSTVYDIMRLAARSLNTTLRAENQVPTAMKKKKKKKKITPQGVKFTYILRNNITLLWWAHGILCAKAYNFDAADIGIRTI